MEVNEVYLSHHGVKGMKWGVRRYQNPDGTLTAKGRARMLQNARKYEAKVNTSVANNYLARSRRARLTQKAKDARYEVKRSDLQKARQTKEKAAQVKKPKTIKDLSDDELRQRISRLKLEQEYAERLEKEYARLNPKKVKAGEKFLMSVGKDVLAPAAKNVGKKWAEAVFTDMVNRYSKVKIPDNQKKDEKKDKKKDEDDD